jgi:hypothetical protein
VPKASRLHREMSPPESHTGWRVSARRPGAFCASPAVPLTRFAYWFSAQECTIRIDKAREQLDYAPVMSTADGLAQLRAA